MEDVFFIIGSSLNVSRQIYDLLKPETVQVMQFESFEDLSPTSLDLCPTFILVELYESKEEFLSAYALHEIIMDENGEAINYRYLDVNPAFERITGYNAKEVVGKSVLELFPDSNINMIKKYGEVALNGSKIQFEQYSPDLFI